MATERGKNDDEATERKANGERSKRPKNEAVFLKRSIW